MKQIKKIKKNSKLNKSVKNLNNLINSKKYCVTNKSFKIDQKSGSNEHKKTKIKKSQKDKKSTSLRNILGLGIGLGASMLAYNYIFPSSSPAFTVDSKDSPKPESGPSSKPASGPSHKPESGPSSKPASGPSPKPESKHPPKPESGNSLKKLMAYGFDKDNGEQIQDVGGIRGDGFCGLHSLILGLSAATSQNPILLQSLKKKLIEACKNDTNGDINVIRPLIIEELEDPNPNILQFMDQYYKYFSEIYKINIWNYQKKLRKYPENSQYSGYIYTMSNGAHYTLYLRRLPNNASWNRYFINMWKDHNVFKITKPILLEDHNTQIFFPGA